MSVAHEIGPVFDDTIHYLSPASLSQASIGGEDGRLGSFNSLEYYRLFRAQPQYDDLGEYTSPYSGPSSTSFEVPQLERTLAIIKPDAVYYEDVVTRKIIGEGFKILQRRKIHLTPEQVSEVYSQYYGQISFPYLVVSMSAAPVIVFCLAASNAINKWKNIVKSTGTLRNTWFFPKSMRIQFGLQASLDNVLHASEDLSSANREIRYFFPQMILEPLLTHINDVTDFLILHVNPTLVKALTELCRKKPVEPLIYFAEWLLLNNPNQPKMIPELAKLPT